MKNSDLRRGSILPRARSKVFAASGIRPLGKAAIPCIVVATGVAEEFTRGSRDARRSQDRSQHKADSEEASPELSDGESENRDDEPLQQGADNENHDKDLKGTRAHGTGLDSVLSGGHACRFPQQRTMV